MYGKTVDEIKKELLVYIDEENLETGYGGKNTYKPEFALENGKNKKSDSFIEEKAETALLESLETGGKEDMDEEEMKKIQERFNLSSLNDEI